MPDEPLREHDHRHAYGHDCDRAGATPAEPKSSEIAATGGGTAADSASTPRDLKVKIAEQKLLIEWADGLKGEFLLSHLRRVCPCAICRTERSRADGNPLNVLKAEPAGLRVVNARLVGNYAIRFDWSDGHDTGIYDFRFLRSLAVEAR